MPLLASESSIMERKVCENKGFLRLRTKSLREQGLSLSLNRKRCLNTKRFLFIDGAGFIVGERFLSESFQCASDNLLKMIRNS